MVEAEKGRGKGELYSVYDAFFLGFKCNENYNHKELSPRAFSMNSLLIN
jgi:hypothetical protein